MNIFPDENLLIWLDLQDYYDQWDALKTKNTA